MPLRVVYSKKYEIHIDEHPWQINKYKELCEAILKKGWLARGDIIYVNEASDDDISLAHSWDYISKIKEGTLSADEILRTELPLSQDLIRFFWTSAQGTIVACREALEHKAAVHLGGGFHHAFSEYGSGFCLLNDIAVGILKMKFEQRIQKALVVDLDVHQGDGTARIFEDDRSVFTFSMHQENNFPYYKQKSNLDIGLEDRTGDEEYLAHLKKNLPHIIESHKPDLIVYVAGADTYREDLLGGLGLSIEGLKARDEFVFEQAQKNNIPVAVTLAGGYAKNPQDTVTIHLNTVQTAMNYGDTILN